MLMPDDSIFRFGPYITHTFFGATDASLTDRKSTLGYVIFLHGSAVFRICRKQNTVAISTTELELTALSYDVRETIGLSRLLRQLDAAQDSVISNATTGSPSIS
jgi:hypothetical protein